MLFSWKSIKHAILSTLKDLPVEENLHSPFENLSKIWLHGAVVLCLSQPGSEKVQE